MSKKYMSIILVIIWMSVIFIMSSFDGSVSSSQSNFIVDKLVNIFNIENTDIVSLIVRKLAHYMEYLILGVLMINMFSEFDIKINTKYIITKMKFKDFKPFPLLNISNSCNNNINIFIYNYLFQRYHSIEFFHNN